MLSSHFVILHQDRDFCKGLTSLVMVAMKQPTSEKQHPMRDDCQGIYVVGARICMLLLMLVSLMYDFASVRDLQNTY